MTAMAVPSSGSAAADCGQAASNRVTVSGFMERSMPTRARGKASPRSPQCAVETCREWESDHGHCAKAHDEQTLVQRLDWESRDLCRLAFLLEHGSRIDGGSLWLSEWPLRPPSRRR